MWTSFPSIVIGRNYTAPPLTGWTEVLLVSLAELTCFLFGKSILTLSKWRKNSSQVWCITVLFHTTVLQEYPTTSDHTHVELVICGGGGDGLRDRLCRENTTFSRIHQRKSPKLNSNTIWFSGLIPKPALGLFLAFVFIHMVTGKSTCILSRSRIGRPPHSVHVLTIHKCTSLCAPLSIGYSFTCGRRDGWSPKPGPGALRRHHRHR